MCGAGRLGSVRWWYPRRLTTVAVCTVAVIGAALAYAALPSSLRPSSALWVLPAALAAYLALVVGAHKGWTKRFKHEVLDRLGGNVDDATPWLLATATGAVFLLGVALLGRAGG